LITELNVGGAEMVLTRLLKRLNRKRFVPVVACFYGGDSPLANEIRALKIPVVDLGMTAKWRFDGLGRLYRLLRREQPLILHTWLFHANLAGRVAGRLAKVPLIICSERTMMMESEARYRLNRWTITLVDRVIAVSNNVRDFCETHIGLPAAKIVVILNGIEVPAEPAATSDAARLALGLSRHTAIVGTVSRLRPEKGIDVLLQAFSQVERAELVIIGDGGECDTLKKLAAELGLTGRVHWAGYRSNISELLAAFDLYVQPSLHEGLPNTVLEAMAARLPVVATAVGGTTEAVLNDVTGRLLSPGDPAALAGAINFLLGEADTRQTMGQAGFERVKKYFNVEQMVAQTESLYTELVDHLEIAEIIRRS
jgi:glycosyltransferase involved in cell wall biosynthesis